MTALIVDGLGRKRARITIDVAYRFLYKKKVYCCGSPILKQYKNMVTAANAKELAIIYDARKNSASNKKTLVHG